MMVPVPKSEITLEITKGKLLDLPPGASFHSRNGQANVDVSTKGDTIIVYASCDSLQRLCEFYESELTRIRSETGNTKETVQEETEHRSNPLKTALIAFIVGVASGIVLTIVIKKRNGQK